MMNVMVSIQKGDHELTIFFWGGGARSSLKPLISLDLILPRSSIVLRVSDFVSVVCLLFSQPILWSDPRASWGPDYYKTDSAQRSSNKCKKYLLKTTHSTVTFLVLLETSHLNSLLQVMTPRWNSQAFSRTLMSDLAKMCWKRAPFWFELTRSVFLMEIWITSNPIFSSGVSLGAEVSISSSYLFSKCDYAASIFG